MSVFHIPKDEYYCYPPVKELVRDLFLLQHQKDELSITDAGPDVRH